MKICVVAQDSSEGNLKEEQLAEILLKARQTNERLDEDYKSAHEDLQAAKKRQGLWQLPLKKRFEAQRRVKSVQDRRRDAAIRAARLRAELEHPNQS